MSDAAGCCCGDATSQGRSAAASAPADHTRRSCAEASIGRASATSRASRDIPQP
eukprot:gene1159-28828_t